MHCTQINPAIAQELFESASNAAAKGLSQFFTPVEFGSRLAVALPKHRPTIVDLTCGNGQLLSAAANQTTANLLGSDIDPAALTTRLSAAETLPGSALSAVPAQAGGFQTGFARPMPAACLCRHGRQASRRSPLPFSYVTADLTLLYADLLELDWFADLFVLNPPWDMHWHRDRLMGMADSEVVAVRQAFQALDPRLSSADIDSTIATLLIALDRSTIYGEGFLIANESTLQRLIFAPGAPYSAIAQHIWLHLEYDGNPMTGEKGRAGASPAVLGASPRTPFKTSVIYFARSHQCVPGAPVSKPALIRQDRHGAELREWLAQKDTALKWHALAHEWKVRQGKCKSKWNLWLHADGTIRTALSLFEQHSVKLNKAEAAKLFQLNGKRPMQLVLQRAQRDELLRHSGLVGSGERPAEHAEHAEEGKGSNTPLLRILRATIPIGAFNPSWSSASSSPSRSITPDGRRSIPSRRFSGSVTWMNRTKSNAGCRLSAA